jgi:hypothetical protein
MKEGVAMNKCITDLGAAAYLAMCKYKVSCKKGKSVYFEVSKEDEEEFDRKEQEYLFSDFHLFDSHLMSIKKMRDIS